MTASAISSRYNNLMRRLNNYVCTLFAMMTSLAIHAQVTAVDDDFLVNENEVWTGNLGANDILPAGSAIYSVVEGPSYGEFTFTTGGNFEYTPPLNEFGFQDSIYYQVCVNGVCDVAGVEFYVIFRNTVPFAGEDSFSVEFNTPRTGNVGLNDGDPDSITDPIDTSLDWFKFTNPTNGIVNVFSIDGTFTYTPNNGFTGSDSFQYYVVDHCGLYAISTVYLTVVGPNLNPTAIDQSITTLSEDVMYSGNLLPLVSDPENDAITFTLLNAPSSGTLQLLSSGSYTYTPPANFTGNVSFTFNACDVVGQCDQGTVSLTINNVDNDPPQLVNDNKILNEDSTGLINASTNDYDDTGTLTYSIVSQPTNGTAALVNANGQFSYTPNANFFGFDNFTIQACDGVNCATSIVNLQVNGINDAPIASPFVLTLNEDTNTSGNITTITDVEPNALVFSIPGGNSIAGLTINSNGSFTYVAAANYFGTQTINLQGCDPQGLCASSTFTLIVNSVNDLPVAVSDNFSINEDQPLSGNLSNGEYDIEGGALSYSTVQVASNGTFNLNSNGQFAYTPNSNWFGTETININVCDSQDGCTDTQLTITVTAVNDLPTTTPANLNTNEDNVLTGNLSSYAFDVETAALTYSLQTPPTTGTFNLSSSGSFTFTPAVNFNGTLSASYQACDASNACVSGIITLVVASVNDAPIAASLNINLNEDQTATGIVTGISDVDHSNLIITVTSGAENGTFTLSNSGAYNYSPNANYFGSESITYNVCDPLGLCATGNISIQIASVEDIPQASGESLAVIEGNALVGDVSINDVDGDGDPLSYSIITAAINGELDFNADGTFSYLPNNGFLGNETITYLVCDDNGNCASASLSIDVLTSNTAPSATPVEQTIGEDESITVNLLSNIIDAEGGAFLFTTIQAPQFGTLQWLGNGSFIYTPATNYFGSDSFTFSVCDNGGLCADSQVSLTILAVNDAPTTSISNVEMNEDDVLMQNIGSGDLDAEGDAISYTLISNATNGDANLSITGEFTYTPAANYSGTDTISYQICDEYNACTENTLIIVVNPLNDAPQATGLSATILEDEGLQGNLSEYVVHVDDEALFFGAMISASNGTIVIQNNGTYSYSPNSNYYGTDQFVYLVCDPFGECDTATVFVNVQSVNDSPVVSNDNIVIDEDGSMEINAAANDYEVENQNLSYSLLGNSSLGNLILTPSGNVTFTANDNAFGSEAVTLLVCDSEGLCSESSLIIQINAVNDSPIVNTEIITINEDATMTFDLNEVVFDVESSTLTFIGPESTEHGTLNFYSSGTFDYAPYENYFGTEFIPFTVCDGEGACTEGIIEIQVISINDAPQAQNTQITLSEDSATEGSLYEFVTDVDDIALFFTVLQNTLHGTLITSTDGAFAYAPGANYFGLDTVIFSVCDAAGLCDTITIELEVTFVNDLPIINNEGVQIIVNNAYTGSVASNDIELDFEPLVYTIQEDQSGGTFILEANGNFTYTPAIDTTGLFTVTYVACDPCNACEYGVITIYVVSEEEANTPPNASNFSGQLCPGNTITINLFDLISDTEEPSINLNLSFGTANSGNYQLDAETQELIYQASPFANETVVIPYYVCDNGVISMCDTAMIILDILPESSIEITSFYTEHVTCFGAADGSIEIEAQTSLGTINYNWNNGAESGFINQLSAGVYSVTLSSDAPCPVNQTAQFEIFEPTELVASYEITDLNGTNSTIGDAITLTVSGGSPGYSIEWITPETTIFNESTISINENGNYTFTVTDENNCMYSESIIIAGISENSELAMIEVYPNPIVESANLVVQSNSTMLNIAILDANGRLIATAQPKSRTTTLRTEGWAAGLYTLRVETTQGITNSRVVKQ
jgi:VCBS repeat-containing protein